MSRFSRNKNNNQGVSAIVGVLVLVLLVLVLSAGVLFTANNMLGEQPTDMTAGTTTERITDYEYQTQLVSQGNAQTVEVVSPLGTHYKLTQVGDATRILAVAPNGNESQVRDMRVVGLEQKTDRRVDNEDAVQKTGEQQVLERKPVKDGIEADVIVDKYGTGDYKSIQTAINTIDSAVNRPITKDNPAVIVVERAVYKENIDVSQNISLIAEHGTIIEDSEPNENVVNIKGDNTEFRNFDINGDPVPNDNHYGLHGINIEGESAEVVGNHVYNSSSPDLTSAGVNIAGDAAILKFNSVESNQRSFNFDDGAKYPFVCGNQLENTISGQLSQRNINEVTKNNYWKEGVPVSLIPEDSNGENGNWSEVRQRIIESNNKVPVNEIPADVGRAGQPFPGTKLQAGELSGCDLQISFSNPTDTSFNIENLEIQIEDRNTTLDVVARDTVTYETGAGANKREQTETQVVCYCGGDNEWDRNDTFELDPIEANISTNPVEAAQSVDIIRDGNAEPGDPSQPDYEEPDWERPENTEKCTGTTTEGDAVIHGVCLDKTVTEKKTTQEKTDSSPETQTFQIILGKTVEVQLADKVTMSAAVSGAQGEVGYEWSLGDGTNKSGKQISHLYEDPGSYDVCLYAWDKTTGESDYDCTTATVEEGKKDLEKIRQEEKEKLQERIDEAKEDKVIYLEEGSYDSLNIKVPGLTVIGNGDVNIVNHAEITAEDVTIKNVNFNNGISVYQDGVKLWKVEASNPSGYAVEIDTDENKLAYIGQSTLSGKYGVSLNTDAEVTIQNTYITAEEAYGVNIGDRMNGIRLTGNTITSGEYGIYRGHASTMYLEDNSISSPQRVYRVANQPPEVTSVDSTASVVGPPVKLNPDIEEPQGDRISHVLWSVEGESKTYKLSPGENFQTSFDNPGTYNVTIQPVDQFGKAGKHIETLDVKEFSADLQGTNVTGVGKESTVKVVPNVKNSLVYSYKYEWGDGEESRLLPQQYNSKTHVYDNTGTYTVTVTIQTDWKETITVTKDIQIKDTPVPKIAVEDTGEDGVVSVDETVALNASESFIPSGFNNPQFKWDTDRDGDFEQTGQTIDFSAESLGTHKLDLQVSVGDGIQETRTVSVDVTSFTVTPNLYEITLVNSPLTVDPTTDISADKLSHYRVKWSDEGSFTQFTDSKQTKYTSTGVYNVTVQAVSTTGATATKTTQVEVIEDTFGDKSLQTVVDNADSCEEVVVPPGVYNHTVVDKCVTLTGSGDATSVKGLKITSGDAVVKNLQSTERLRAYADGATVKNVYGSNNDGWAFDLRGNDMTVDNLRVDAQKGIYAQRANNLEISNSNIKTTNGPGIHFYEDEMGVFNSQITAEGQGISIDSRYGANDISLKDSSITATGNAIQVEDESLYGLTLNDLTIDAQKDLFSYGDGRDFGLSNVKTSGTFDIKNGNNAFNTLTRGYNNSAGTVKLTDTKMYSTNGNGPTIKYPSDYISNSNSVNIRGEKYTLTRDKSIQTTLRIRGEQMTVKGITHTKSTGYSMIIYGRNNELTESSAKTTVYVHRSQKTQISNTTIDSAENGVKIYEDEVSVINSDITAGKQGILINSQYGANDISLKDSSITATGNAIQVEDESLYGLTLNDLTIDVQKDFFSYGDGRDFGLSNVKTSGTFDIKNGNNAFNTLTRGYNSSANTVKLTDTKMYSTNGNGPTIKYPSDYISNSNSVNIRGEKYTLTRDKSIQTTLRIRGEQMTVKGITHTKSTGYSMIIYGRNNELTESSVKTTVYVYRSQKTQISDTTIDSAENGVKIYEDEVSVINSDITAGKQGILINSQYGANDISLKDSSITATGNAIQVEDESLYGLTLNDLTIDVQKDFFSYGDGRDFGLSNVKTSGTFDIKNGNNAFNILTRGYNNSAGTVKLTDTKMYSTNGNGPTIKYPSDYISNSNSVNIRGEKYTLTRDKSIQTKLRIRGAKMTVKGITHTKSTGYSMIIYGRNNELTESSAKTTVYVHRSQKTQISNTTIDSDGHGVYIYEDEVSVINSDITAGKQGILINSQYGANDISLKDTNIKAVKNAIHLADESLYGLTLNDLTINAQRDVFSYGDGRDFGLSNVKTSGTFDIKNGNNAFNIFTRGYNSSANTVKLTDTKMYSTDGTGPTIKYPSDYISNSNSVNIRGDEYTLTRDKSIQTTLRIRGEQMTVKGITHTKSTGYSMRIYGRNNELTESSAKTTVYVYRSQKTQISNTTIDSAENGVKIYEDEVSVINSDITAGKQGILINSQYGANDISLKDSSITATGNAIQVEDESLYGLTLNDLTLDVQKDFFSYGDGRDFGLSNVKTSGTFDIKNGNNAFNILTRGYTDADVITLSETETTVEEGSGPTLKYDSNYISSQDALYFSGSGYTLEKLYNPSTPINIRGNNIQVTEGN